MYIIIYFLLIGIAKMGFTMIYSVNSRY